MDFLNGADYNNNVKHYFAMLSITYQSFGPCNARAGVRPAHPNGRVGVANLTCVQGHSDYE